jgi:polysaccharide biosynthesis protein PslG
VCDVSSPKRLFYVWRLLSRVASKGMKSRLLLVWFLAALAVSANAQHINPHLNARSTQADVQGYYWMPTAVADDYFDGTSSRERVRMHMQVAHETGAKYLRCAFTWNAIEKQQGHYNWAFWDTLVDEAERANIQLIPYVAYTPEWAAENSDQFWKRPPRDPQLYADFMYKIASRYRGRIHSWEIWNEPDIGEYWMGSPDQFAELVKLAAPAIRRADPDATLVLAGMSKGPSPFFQTLVQKHHVERLVDVVAMHGYPESWLEERAETVDQSWIGEMNRLVVHDGVRRDFWLNEIGYADYRYSPMSGKVSLTAWYRVDDFDPKTTTFSDDHVNFHLGLLDKDQHPKPTFFALKHFNELFDQPTRPLVTRIVSNQVLKSDAVMNMFERQDGKLVVVGWLRSLNRREAPKADGNTPDNRREDVAVQLPCAAVSDVSITDTQGRSAAAFTTFHNGWFDGMRLRPDKIFVAEMNCSPTQTQFAHLLR